MQKIHTKSRKPETGQILERESAFYFCVKARKQCSVKIRNSILNGWQHCMISKMDGKRYIYSRKGKNVGGI